MTSSDALPDTGAIAERIASRFSSRFIQGYVRGKVKSDPVYPAVLERMRAVEGPVLDLGCGIGLLGLFLRECGLDHEVVGVDFDARKIETGRRALSGLTGLSLAQGDARDPIRYRGSVALLDLLHYFGDEEQATILGNAADCARPGDVVVVRDCIRDGTWRYRLTWLEETFATSIGWLRGERLNFPTKESIVREFRERGFDEEVVPLWGRTPFNNYLLTFRRR